MQRGKNDRVYRGKKDNRDKKIPPQNALLRWEVQRRQKKERPEMSRSKEFYQKNCL